MNNIFTNIGTPHIAVKDEPFSKSVLMPGDPKRAEMIANKFLTNVKVISDIRGIKALKGFYNNKDVTIMASGMGMPSIGIYSHELFNNFGVEEIIRIGSAGAINKNLNLGDIVIAQAASTNSNYFGQFNLQGGTFAPVSNFETLMSLVNSAKEKNIEAVVGNILSTDTFYSVSSPNWEQLGILATEMESAALFTEAVLANKKAGSICTISDLVFDHSRLLTAEERENNLINMIIIALDAVTKEF